MAEELKLPSKEEIQRILREEDIDPNMIAAAVRHVGVSEDLQQVLGSAISPAGQMFNQLATGPQTPDFMSDQPQLPEQSTGVDVLLLRLMEEDPARFRAVWAIIEGGSSATGDSGYMQAHRAWAEAGADPAVLAERFGFDPGSVNAGPLNELSDEDFEEEAGWRSRLVNEYSNTHGQETYLEIQNRELTRRDMIEQGASEEDANATAGPLAELSPFEAQLQANKDAGIGSSAGLYTPREMELLRGYINNYRGFFEGADSPSLSGLLGNQEALEQTLGVGQNDPRANPALLGARFTVKFDPTGFGASRRGMLGSLEAAPLFGAEAQNFDEMTGQGVLVEPAMPGRTGAGGFQDEGQRIDAFGRGEMTLDEMKQWFMKANDADVEAMQRDLWRMGYFGERSILSGEIPTWGVRDNRTREAFFTMVYDLFGTEHSDYRLLRNARIREYAGTFRDLKNSVLGIEDPDSINVEAVDVEGVKASMQVLSDEDSEDLIQAEAQKTIGKRLNKNEVQAVMAVLRAGQDTELGQRVSHERRVNQANAEMQRQALRRARLDSLSGGGKFYDSEGFLITPTINPNRTFDPDTAGGGQFVEPVAGMPTDMQEPPPNTGQQPMGDTYGADVISTIESAPTATAVSSTFLRQNMGSQVFARDAARSVAVLRGMIGGR